MATTTTTPSLKLSPMTVDDLSHVPSIFFSAFSHDPFHTLLFPDIPSVHSWWLAINGLAFHHDPTVVFLKVTDPSSTTSPNVPIAWAKWIKPPQPDQAPANLEGRWPDYPDDTPHELLDDFFGKMEKQHVAVMGERPHYFLELIGVRKEYQGEGAGGLLVSWGCQKVDEKGLECYLDAAPWAKPMFERFGFEVRGKEMMLGGKGYKEYAMVRTPAHGRSRLEQK